MLYAREIEVTPADAGILENEVGRILYAEWAEPGAMGCSGSARIYLLEGDELRRYMAYYPDYYELAEVYTSINYLSDNSRLIRDFPPEEAQKRLDEAVQAGKIPKPCFLSVRGGFGNFAWINKGAGLQAEDAGMGLVYRFNGKEYFIECSVDGVYNCVRQVVTPDDGVGAMVGVFYKERKL